MEQLCINRSYPFVSDTAKSLSSSSVNMLKLGEKMGGELLGPMEDEEKMKPSP